MKLVSIILLSFLLTIPRVGFSIVIDVCCITTLYDCCDDPVTFDDDCCQTLTDEACSDIFFLELPPLHLDYTVQQSTHIPLTVYYREYDPVIFSSLIYKKGTTLRQHQPIHLQKHPSFFQVFLC